jgi:hypothetical protein
MRGYGGNMRSFLHLQASWTGIGARIAVNKLERMGRKRRRSATGRRAETANVELIKRATRMVRLEHAMEFLSTALILRRSFMFSKQRERIRRGKKRSGIILRLFY